MLEALQLQPLFALTLTDPSPPDDVNDCAVDERLYEHEVNVAVTVVFDPIDIEQSPVPLHPPPDQLSKAEPESGEAVRVTDVPEL